MSVKQAVEHFVTAYNRPGSDVYPLYGKRVEWIEMPSGRAGGRDELFVALAQSRQYFTRLNMKTLSIIVDGDDAMLESELALTSAEGAVLRARTIWIFGFAAGKIVKEHDYSIVLKD